MRIAIRSGVLLLATTTLAAVVAGEELSAKPAAELLGRKIEGFSLQDFRGKPHSLADFADKEAVVVYFLGTECPVAKLYSPRVQKLAEQFEPKGVAFLGVSANAQDSVTELAAFARLNG